MPSLRFLFLHCLISDVLLSSAREKCPRGEVWLESGGCDNTCECPSRICDPKESRPGCFCDPASPFLVRRNSSCVRIWECEKLEYRCCPPCSPIEECALTQRSCPRPPCPPPMAMCTPKTPLNMDGSNSSGF